MEDVEVGRYAKIKRAIIDKGVKIPSDMRIGYDIEEDKKRFYVSPNGIVVISKGTILSKRLCKVHPVALSHRPRILTYYLVCCGASPRSALHLELFTLPSGRKI